MDERGNEKLTGLIEAGHLKDQVHMAWLASYPIQELNFHSDAELELTFVDEMVSDVTDEDMPTEARSLSRRLRQCHLQIMAMHTAHVGNGSTEASTTRSSR